MINHRLFVRRPAFPEAVPGSGDGLAGSSPFDNLRPLEFGEGQHYSQCQLPDSRVIDPADIQDIDDDAFLRKLADRPQAVFRVPGEPVEFAAHELVAW